MTRATLPVGPCEPNFPNVFQGPSMSFDVLSPGGFLLGRIRATPVGWSAWASFGGFHQTPLQLRPFETRELAESWVRNNSERKK